VASTAGQRQAPAAFWLLEALTHDGSRAWGKDLSRVPVDSIQHLDSHPKSSQLAFNSGRLQGMFPRVESAILLNKYDDFPCPYVYMGGWGTVTSSSAPSTSMLSTYA